MSLNTFYGGLLIQWSFETWDDKIREILTNNENEKNEEAADIYFTFSRFIADPRMNVYYGHYISVKEPYFKEFQEWAAKRGHKIDKQEKAFTSMTCWKNTPLSIDDLKRIKKIEFQEDKI